VVVTAMSLLLLLWLCSVATALLWRWRPCSYCGG
jgi:hypothetical protein